MRAKLLGDSLLNRFAAAAKDLARDKAVHPSKQPVINGNCDFCNTHYCSRTISMTNVKETCEAKSSSLNRTYSEADLPTLSIKAARQRSISAGIFSWVICVRRRP